MLSKADRGWAWRLKMKEWVGGWTPDGETLSEGEVRKVGGYQESRKVTPKLASKEPHVAVP